MWNYIVNTVQGNLTSSLLGLSCSVDALSLALAAFNALIISACCVSLRFRFQPALEDIFFQRKPRKNRSFHKN